VKNLKLLKKLQDKLSGVIQTGDLPEEFRSLLVTGDWRKISANRRADVMVVVVSAAYARP
jgi:hypothetical protein